jgi:hypothetical protein
MRGAERAGQLVVVATAALALVSLGAVGCTKQKERASTGTAGTGAGPTGTAGTGAAPAGTAGTMGAAGTTGAAGTGAAPAGAAGTGSSASGAAGTGATGAAGTGTSGIDNGFLFHDAGAVVMAPEPMGSSDGGTKAEGGSSPAGVGTLHINSMGLTAVFTQKGADVTMAVTATNCTQGAHTIQIHGGFSCDNTSTQGGVWDGKRGDGIPALNCGADKKGTLSYTRSGADPSTNWTVGDHNTKTDVTLHPAMAEGNCGTFF